MYTFDVYNIFITMLNQTLCILVGKFVCLWVVCKLRFSIFKRCPNYQNRSLPKKVGGLLNYAWISVLIYYINIIFICIFIYLYIYIYTYIHIYIYTYMHMYIYTWEGGTEKSTQIRIPYIFFSLWKIRFRIFKFYSTQGTFRARTLVLVLSKKSSK